jgi:hypothetical protein
MALNTQPMDYDMTDTSAFGTTTTTMNNSLNSGWFAHQDLPLVVTLSNLNCGFETGMAQQHVCMPQHFELQHNAEHQAMYDITHAMSMFVLSHLRGTANNINTEFDTRSLV